MGRDFSTRDAILTLLRGAGQTRVSGEEISRKLKITRGGIWKHIRDLRQAGYRIDAVQNNGYRLDKIPDKLFPCEIQYGLRTRFIGRDIRYFDEIDSSMNEAARLGQEGADEGLLVVAETQTRGRGRLGRSWNSPKGKGLYASVLLRPDVRPAAAGAFTMLVAVAVCETVREVTDLDVKLKWPNDLLIGGQKVGGCLTEIRGEVDRVHSMVCGFGLNVTSTAKQLPEKATSLREQGGRVFDRIILLRRILENFERRYLEWKDNGFDPVLADWRALSGVLGRRVRVGDLRGTAVDLDSDGALIIRDARGRLVKSTSGDLAVLRG